MFFLLRLKIDFIPEIIYVPLYCNAIKDAIYHLKEMTSLRRLQREYRYFISTSRLLTLIEESYLERLPNILEHLFILLQLIVITLCMSVSDGQNLQLYSRVLPAPYALSLLSRWLFPYLIRQCVMK